MRLEYRTLKREDIKLIRTIDRAELIERVYYTRDGRLDLQNETYDMKGWPPGHADNIILGAYELFDSGGTLVGAFDDEVLVGVIGLENKFRGKDRDTLKMDMLFVSKSYRKQGIGRQLFFETKNIAKKAGAKKLYVSATPSENTLNFYLSRGFKLASEIDHELYALEPDDIHLELELDH